MAICAAVDALAPAAAAGTKLAAAEYLRVPCKDLCFLDLHKGHTVLTHVVTLEQVKLVAVADYALLFDNSDEGLGGVLARVSRGEGG